MKKIWIWFVIGFVIINTFQVSQAWECEYGEVKAWVKLQGDKDWREAPVEGITLKVHEPFYVKVEVKTKTTCHVSINLLEIGSPAFEVIEGNSKMGEMIREDDRPENWVEIYKWAICPNGKWTNGTAPLNIFTQFTKRIGETPPIFL